MISAMMRDYEQQIEDLTQRLNNACVDLVETRAQLALVDTRRESAVRSAVEGWSCAKRRLLAWQSARRRARRYDALADELDERLTAERDEARAEVVRLGRANALLATALREANGNRAVMIAQHRALISVVQEREAAAMAQGAPEFAAATARLRSALAEQRIEPL